MYGVAFLLVALSLAGVAADGGPGLVAAWPALSFCLVAFSYLSGDVRVFGKRPDGTRSLIASVLLLPYLGLISLVWRLSLACTREPAASGITDRLVVARRLLAGELPADVSVVCDLTCEFVEPRSIRTAAGYVCFPMLDAGTAGAAELVRLVSILSPTRGTRVVIHCANGHGRSGLVAAVWLIVHGHAGSADEAVATLRRARPGISLNRVQRRTLDDVVGAYLGATALPSS